MCAAQARVPRRRLRRPATGALGLAAQPRHTPPQPTLAVDASVLVHAFLRDSPHHALATGLVDQLCHGATAWAIPWPSVHEFLVMATHPRGSVAPVTLAQAFATLQRWQAAGNLSFIGEHEGYLEHLGAEALAADARGARLYDARIATLCIQNGVRELWSAERGFRRFPHLAVHNPLQPPTSVHER